MKTINVVAAIIRDGEKVFATQRGYGEFKGGWEFPGGKIETGETLEEALIREIKEELNVDIKVGNNLGSIEYDYPTFHLSMNTFLCEIIKGEIVLLEHDDARWVTINDLRSVDWLPADNILIENIEEELKLFIK